MTGVMPLRLRHSAQLGAFILGGVVLVFLALVPIVIDTYWVRVMTNVLYLSIAVAGLNIAFGVLGKTSVGHGAFMAVGAYTAAIIARDFGLPFWLAIPAGIATGALAGVVLAAPGVRAEGKYFTMLTIAFGSIVYAVVSRWTDFTGGPSGIAGFGFAPKIFADNPISNYYYICLIFAVIVWLFCGRLIMTRWGKSLVGVRTAEPAMKALGMNTALWKIGAIVFSAALGGLGGVLQAYQDGYVQSEVYSITLSILLLGSVLVGGRATAAGPVIGAAVLVIGPSLLADLNEYQFLIYGSILLVTGLVAPKGIMGFVSWAMRRRGRLVVTGATTSEAADVAQRLPSLDEIHEATRRRPRTPATDPVLTVTGISKRFGGVKALADVSFEVHRGEIVGLIGGNGSGKTTLANIVSGLLKGDSGTVVLDGTDVTRIAPNRRRGLARTFQHVQLAPELTALDNVVLGFHRDRGATLLGEILGLPRARRAMADRRSRAREILELLGVGDVADTATGDLSYGHQRLIEMGRAIAQRPTVLLFDEPAAGMGRDGLPLIARAIQVLASQGVTVVLIEHHVDLVFAVCERLIVLNEGRKIADGDTDTVRDDPAVISAYLGGHIAPEDRDSEVEAAR
ncbi:branched-chain amino acid ABC transporter ATP-binding protein/permease [Microbacterium sp. CPCC 204701]|uniref:branched-chain amino acid ABC transporter ATP-binding protein/permease n=1 Tax=Microbacterium sp. CPCC 204701 TaxID=2493084 RepID=UPI000FD8FE1E|nr:branched-chain amino acid ABC transporter ATP-binding protein/permease [Microbacterium sp. CPCC 204701]